MTNQNYLLGGSPLGGFKGAPPGGPKDPLGADTFPSGQFDDFSGQFASSPPDGTDQTIYKVDCDCCAGIEAADCNLAPLNICLARPSAWLVNDLSSIPYSFDPITGTSLFYPPTMVIGSGASILSLDNLKLLYYSHLLYTSYLEGQGEPECQSGFYSFIAIPDEGFVLVINTIGDCSPVLYFLPASQWRCMGPNTFTRKLQCSGPPSITLRPVGTILPFRICNAPDILHVTITGAGCLNGIYPLTFDPKTYVWRFTDTPPGRCYNPSLPYPSSLVAIEFSAHVFQSLCIWLVLRCSGTLDADFISNPDVTTMSCNPIFFDFSINSYCSVCGSGGGYARAVVTL